MSRALRRHHRDRLNNRVRHFLKKYAKSSFYPWSEEDLAYQVNRRRDNRQMCSCWMCGNPRRRNAGWNFERLTLQEWKQIDSERDQWLEVDY